MVLRLLQAEANLCREKKWCYASGIMVANIVPTISALEAQAAANLFLSDNLPDRFCANNPRLDSIDNLWRVRVVLAYPFIGPIGEVGEIVVSTSSEEIISHTPLDEMWPRARRLYEQHREAIEAAFAQTRNA